MTVSRLSVWLVALVLLLAAPACTGSSPDKQPDEPASGSGGPAVAPPSAPVPTRPRIVVLGDSLTAGLGLSPDEAYPAVLQRKVAEVGSSLEVVNAGVSGDTSAGGLRRLDWALDGDVRIVVLALGANDGLRGVPVAETRRNLSAIIERARDHGAAVLLAGMEAPPNFGPVYTIGFRNLFRDLASDYKLPFVPFLLEGVAGVPSLNQADGIHPTAEGARLVADRVWVELKPMVDAVKAR